MWYTKQVLVSVVDKTVVHVYTKDIFNSRISPNMTGIVHFLYFQNPKLSASSQLLCMYSSVCVVPVRKPRLFSQEVANLQLFAYPKNRHRSAVQ